LGSALVIGEGRLHARRSRTLPRREGEVGSIVINVRAERTPISPGFNDEEVAEESENEE